MILTKDQAQSVYRIAKELHDMAHGATAVIEFPDGIQVTLVRGTGPIAVWKKYTEMTHFSTLSKFAKAHELTELY